MAKVIAHIDNEDYLFVADKDLDKIDDAKTRMEVNAVRADINTGILPGVKTVDQYFKFVPYFEEYTDTDAAVKNLKENVPGKGFVMSNVDHMLVES